MIDFFQGTVIDLFPNKDDPQLQALSFALKNAIALVWEKSVQSMVYAQVDSLPEKVLDLLAVELRSMYYDQTLGIEQKRGIIKNTLAWYRKAGTPAAVSELVQVVFGEGYVVEWFDFDEDEGEVVRGTFDVVTNAQLSGDVLERFQSIIRKVKNTRSHLRRVVINRKNFIDGYIGMVHTCEMKFEIHDNGLGEWEETNAEF